MPPNEKRGRVHTSTVTVAVMREPTATEVRLDERDLDFRTCRGSGAGGQHRNTSDTAVQLTHVPTGLRVRVESERSQLQNKASARALLGAKLLELERNRLDGDRNRDRRDQVGSGMRADKRRTIALQRGQVTDHVTGRTIDARSYLRGGVESLWP